MATTSPGHGFNGGGDGGGGCGDGGGGGGLGSGPSQAMPPMKPHCFAAKVVALQKRCAHVKVGPFMYLRRQINNAFSCHIN
jgi:hypothetical protein